jgi:hypothetical protein
MTIKLKGTVGGSVSFVAPSNTSPSGTAVSLTLPTSAGSNGQYLQTNGSGTLSWQTIADTAVSVAVLVDEKTQNTAGGTFTAGDWRTRDLNTEVSDPDGIVTISSNQFTLGAGTYLISWECPAYRVEHHQSRLYDVTGTAEVEVGMSQYARNDRVVENISPGSVVVAPTANNTYEIQHQGALTFATEGFGRAPNFGPEHYTRVTIYKIA